ncbi:MAG: lactonase family protein [bacterium]|nr:lactonase family protein [bacterium]
MSDRWSLLACSAAFLLVATSGAQPLVIEDTVCDVDFPTCVGGTQGVRGARTVAVSPDGAHAYVATSLDDALLALSLDPLTGELAPVQSIFDTDAGIDGLDSARGVTVSPDGDHVYVAALVDSSLAAFSRSAATGMLTFVEAEFDGAGGVDGLAGAHAVTVSPDGDHVYVASRSESAVAAFERDAGTGAVTFLEAEFDNIAGVDGLDAAESVTVSPDGKHVYVAGEGDDAVAVFERETDSGEPDFGELSFVEAQFDGAGGVDGLEGAGWVAVSPDGDHVYVASERGSLGGIAGDDWIAVFERNAATGALTFVESHDESEFGTSTTGIFAFCTGVGNENSGVAVAPDGGHVYYTNPFFGTVASFDRNATTGALSLSGSICDLSFGADGIAGAIGITTSPDGRHLLTASSGFETVASLEQAIFVDGFESGNTSAWN